MRTIQALALFVVAATSSSCALTSVSRTGERFASYPKDCAIDYRYGDMMKAMSLMQAGYVQVGTISVARAGDSFDDAMKATVGPLACEIGGELVMMAASSAGSATSGSSYASLMVFRKTSAPGSRGLGSSSR